MTSEVAPTSTSKARSVDGAAKTAKRIRVQKGDDGKPASVHFPERTVDDPVVVQLFDETAEGKYDAVLADVLRIGSVALLDDRISAALEDADNQIRGRFAQLQILMDLRRARWERGTGKGEIGEAWVGSILSEYAARNGWDDRFERTGTEGGELTDDRGRARNKSGDVIATTAQGKRIAIEVKFADLPEGPLEQRDYGVKFKDSAWSQIVEAMANRNCDAGFIVFDRSTMNPALRKAIPDLGYLEGAGLVCVVDWESGRRDNLYAAYSIARSLVHAKEYTRQPEVVAALLTQAQAIIAKLQKLDVHLAKIRKSAHDIIKVAGDLGDEMAIHDMTLAAIGDQLETARSRGLTAQDQLTHYTGDGIRRMIEARQGEAASAMD